jgi:DNA-binding response OmpR family regulator
VTTPIRLLYAEDNPSDSDLTREHFAANAPDFTLDIVTTGAACLERLRGGRYDVLLLDNHLTDMDGVDVLRAVTAWAAPPPVVIVTGLGDEGLVVQVLRRGARDNV